MFVEKELMPVNTAISGAGVMAVDLDMDTNNVQLILDDGATGAGNGAIYFGQDTDLSLYRSAANTLMLEGSLHVSGGNLLVNAAGVIHWDSGTRLTMPVDGQLLLDNWAGTAFAKLQLGPNEQAADTAVAGSTIKATNAYSQAATNTTGGPLYLGGGVGTKKITCLFASIGTSTLTFTVDGGTPVTITEGTEWNKDTDDDLTAAALVTYLDANIAGFTATAVANVVWLDPATTTRNIQLSSANGGGTACVVVNGVTGSTVVVGGPATTGFTDSVQYGIGGPRLAGAVSGSMAALNAAGSAYTTLYVGSLSSFGAVGVGATSALSFTGRTKIVSSADGIWEMGINAGTRGVRFDAATAANVLALYDESGNALGLTIGGAMTAPYHSAGSAGTTGYFYTADTSTATATGIVHIASGNQLHGDDLDSGAVNVYSGSTATDGDTGDVSIYTGTAGAGAADAGDIYLAVNGAPGASTTALKVVGATGVVQKTNGTIGIPLTDCATYNAMIAPLPAAGAAGDLGLVDDVTGGMYLITGDVQQDALVFSAGLLVRLPEWYTPGGTVKLRLKAGQLDTVASDFAVVDVLAYVLDHANNDTTISGDLCETSAQSCNSTTLASKDFTIDDDASGYVLAAGNILQCKINYSIDDSNGDANPCTGVIVHAELIISA